MNRKPLTRALLLAALAALVPLAGCGGGGESAQASLSPAQFRKKADFICEGAGNEQGELAAKYKEKHPSATEADMVKVAAVSPLEKQLEELKELPAPKSLEAHLQAFFAAFEAGLEAGREEPLSLLRQKHNPFERSDELGEKFELGDCAIAP